MTTRNELIQDSLNTWAPNYPRRVTRNQYWSEEDGETIRLLREAEERDGDSPFISAYSFPRGHTKDDEIPHIDTLFIDFDIEDGEYERGSGNRGAWKRDLSELLVRARRVADFMKDSSKAGGWRASLSGHKGIHLFADFPALEENVGTFDQYVTGMNEYAIDLIDDLASETGLGDLQDYVDVTSSDLGRLCRVPNTVHSGATESFDEQRFCVPVSLDELAELTPDEYEELTREPREVPFEQRQPIDEVGRIIEQYVQTATPDRGGHSGGSGGGGAGLDWSRVDEYRETSNDNLSLNDVRMLTSDMPCVWEYYTRDDKYQHGYQSFVMETHCITKLLDNNFPISVIHDFLDSAPEYSERYSQERIEKLIAQSFKPYRNDTLLREAPEFVGYDFCARCQSVIAENEDLQQW